MNNVQDYLVFEQKWQHYSLDTFQAMRPFGATKRLTGVSTHANKLRESVKLYELQHEQ